MPEFNKVHPEYRRWRDRWQMSWDFYRGGLHIHQPAFEQRLSFLVRSHREDSGLANDGSSGPNPDGSRTFNKFEWLTSRFNSYLWSHEREGLRRFENRQSRSSHIPITRPVVDSLVSGVLRPGAERLGGDVFPWKVYFKDVDLTGTNIDMFARKALTGGVVKSKMFAVTDMPAFDELSPSLEAQLAAGIRPYTYLVSPLDVLDWSLDDKGNFRWVKIRESQPDDSGPFETGEGFGKFQHRIWYTDHWELWRSVTEESSFGPQPEMQMVGRGDYPSTLRHVPVRVFMARKSQDSKTSLESDSLVTDLVDLDRAVYNLLSLLHENEYAQTFAQLILPGESGDFGPVEIGPWQALVYPGEGGGTPAYIGPDPDIAKGLWERISGLIQAARASSSLSRGVAEQSKESRSAAAISYESENKYVEMAALAEQLDEFENGIYQDVAAWSGISPDNVPVVKRPRRFDVRSTSQQIDDALRLAQLQIGPGPLAEVSKPIVSRILTENGVEEAIIDNVMAEIEKGNIGQAPDFADRRADFNSPERTDLDNGS